MKDLFIFIGGYIGKNNYSLLIKKYFKKNISVSNSEYERIFFESFLAEYNNSYLVSVPGVGRFPFYCSKPFYKRVLNNDKIFDCSYCTIFGLSHLTKEISIRKTVMKLIKQNRDKKIHIIAFEAHRPYLNVLKSIKEKYKCSTALIVPDYPENVRQSNNFIYNFLKKRDVKLIKKISEKYVDYYLFFTNDLAKKIFTNNKPYIVRQGILQELSFKKNINKKIKCVFIGKTDKRNGIEFIINASKELPDFDFEIYGSGDYDDELKLINIRNLKYYGFINPNSVDQAISNADILLSPRMYDESYTSLSFPSNVLKYIAHYKPIVTFKLPCYSREFDGVLIYPKNESIDEFVKSIKRASSSINSIYYKKIVNKKLNYLFSKNLVHDFHHMLKKS